MTSYLKGPSTSTSPTLRTKLPHRGMGANHMQISAQRLFGQLRVIVSKEEATVRKEVWRGLVTNPVKIFGF